MASQPYQQRVPAVSRAVEALERLVEAREPLALSSLARQVHAHPSSLLAILTTLRASGLVTRSETDGRYSPGPGLVALGSAAAARLDACQTFEGVAGPLAAETGETVVLWVLEEGGATLVAARESARSVRYVPRLGQVVPSVLFDRGPFVQLELEPGVALVGMDLPARVTQPRSVVAVAGPEHRLGGSAAEAARDALARVIGGEAGTEHSAQPGSWELAGPIAAAEVDAFLGQGLVATLSYLSDDSYPSTVPLWYDWDGSAFWLIPRSGSEWVMQVRRNPRVSLAVSESVPPLRRVLARGPVQSVPDPGHAIWRQMTARLVARYAGFDRVDLLVTPPAELLRLTPEQLIAWRGLLQHPGAVGRRAPAATRDSA